MHPFQLSKEVTDRIISRRGKLHIYDDLVPNRTALVVIDMQNTFLEKGALTEVPVAREIVPNINRLASTLRSTGGIVAWVQASFKPEGPTAWTSYFNHVTSRDFGKQIEVATNEKSNSYALWHELDVVEGDLFSVKSRFSAFIGNASDLPDQLIAHNIDTVIVTGTVTEICCESSARDAMMQNFKTIMVSDANASRSDAEHMAALQVFFQHFGDVYTTEEVINLLV